MAISNGYEKINEINAKLDEAVHHIEASENLILQALNILNIDCFEDIKPVENSANEYIEQVKFFKNKLTKIIERYYVPCVYASPDILSEKNNINWE